MNVINPSYNNGNNNMPPTYDTLFTPQPQYQYQLNYLHPNYIQPNYIQPNYIQPNYIQPNYLHNNIITKQNDNCCCVLL